MKRTAKQMLSPWFLIALATDYHRPEKLTMAMNVRPLTIIPSHNAN